MVLEICGQIFKLSLGSSYQILEKSIKTLVSLPVYQQYVSWAPVRDAAIYKVNKEDQALSQANYQLQGIHFFDSP
jgi:hypothetical protein